MKCLRLIVAGLGLSLVGSGFSWSQAPAAAPRTNSAPSAPGGHNGGVGASVPPGKPASEFTAKQNAAALAAGGAQVREIPFVPDQLPALEAKKVATFPPTPRV